MSNSSGETKTSKLQNECIYQTQKINCIFHPFPIQFYNPLTSRLNEFGSSKVFVKHCALWSINTFQNAPPTPCEQTIGNAS